MRPRQRNFAKQFVEDFVLEGRNFLLNRVSEVADVDG
jgi:hypothetical protein